MGGCRSVVRCRPSTCAPPGRPPADRKRERTLATPVWQRGSDSRLLCTTRGSSGDPWPANAAGTGPPAVGPVPGHSGARACARAQRMPRARWVCAATSLWRPQWNVAKQVVKRGTCLTAVFYDTVETLHSCHECPSAGPPTSGDRARGLHLQVVLPEVPASAPPAMSSPLPPTAVTHNPARLSTSQTLRPALCGGRNMPRTHQCVRLPARLMPGWSVPFTFRSVLPCARAF